MKRKIAIKLIALCLAVFSATPLFAACSKNGNGNSEKNQGTEQGGVSSQPTTNTEEVPKLGTIGKDPGKQLGLYVEDGQVMLGGKQFTGVGINYYDGGFRLVENPLGDSIDKAIANIKEHNVPVMRVRFSSWGTEGMDLYHNYPESFFEGLDYCVRICEQNNIGIIATLAWTTTQYGGSAEKANDFFKNTNSDGFKQMLSYMKAIIDRYKYSPAIWGWEIGNEFNLACNVGGYDCDPDVLGAFYDYISAFIRQCDGSKRVIATGNSQNRGSSYHLWKEGSWTRDTLEQEKTIMDYWMPKNIDIHSIHVYDKQQVWDQETVTLSEYIKGNMDYLKQKGVPLYIGEYCNDTSNEEFRALHDAIVENKVPLAFIWRFTYELDCWAKLENISSYMLDCADEANKYYKQNGMQDIDTYWNNVQKIMGNK